MSQSSQSDLPGKLFKAMVTFLSWFSLKNQQRIGAVLGRIMSWFPNYNRDVIQANLQIAYPDLTQAEYKAKTLNTLQENTKSFTELGALWGWPIERILPLIKTVHGQHWLDEVGAKNKGIFLLSPHFGCWEIVTVYLAQHYDFTFLYQPPKNRSVERYISDARSRTGASAAPANMKGVKTLVKALKQNKVIGILPDQDPGEVGSCYAPFFGHPARTMTLVSKLSKSQEAVLFIIGERLPNGEGFDIHIFPAEKDISNADEQKATAALNRGVENCVKIKPEQYLWSYKRYRHPPEGVEDIYS